MKTKSNLSQVEQEIKRKEISAKHAKQKGMHATYSNYMLDISILKNELQKLRTNNQRRYR